MNTSIGEAGVGCICAQCGEPTDEAGGACPSCGEALALNGRFLLQRIVGQGAEGSTWRAIDSETGTPVAIKEMPIRPGTPLHVRERMAREARVLRELDHPQIPNYIDHFELGNKRHRAFYVVQEFVEGETISDEVARRRLSQVEVVELLDELLGILEYLHALAPPVIHRDLKPNNVIRRASDGALFLIDFGAVRDVVKDPEVGGSTIAGTYGYMAPEQFRGVATPATDLYAVGVIAVSLLSRREVLELIGADHRLEWRASVSAAPGLLQLIERLLADAPEARPPSARAIRETLAGIDLEAPSAKTPALQSPSAGSASALPVGAVERLERSLGADEPILWKGRPTPSAWDRSSIPIALFGIPWTGFALFWTLSVAFMAPGVGFIDYLFPLFGVPFILIGFWLLSAPMRARIEHRNTIFAVTHRQALEVRGPLGVPFWEALLDSPVTHYRGAALRGFERRERGDGTSDFILQRITGEKGKVTEKGLMGVSEGDLVEALLRAAAKHDRA